MADSTNALSYGDSGRGSFLNLLAQSDVANPLAAIKAGTEAASATYDLRQKQANQAIGQILQQSTDENGNVDYQQAQKLAAGAGPVVQAGMQTMLENNANRRGQQIAQTSGLYNLIGSASASGMMDPSDDNIERIRGSLTAAGAPAGALTELDRIKAIPDPNQRKMEFYKHNLSAVDAQHQMAVAGYPQPVQTQMPQGLVTTTTQPPSPYSSGGTTVQPGGVAAGVAPGETQEYTFQPTDAQGKPTGTPYKVTAPKGTVFPSMQGTQITPSVAPAAGGGAANPPGAPAAGSSGIGSGRINPTPANPALRNPAVVQPGGGAPAAAPSIPGAPSGAVATGVPLGQPQAAEATATASAKMGSDLTSRADQVPTNKANYANMLTDLSKIDTMGPGTEKEIAINSVLQKLTGYGITMTPEQIAAGNSFAKLANIAVGQQLAAIGGTDARQALFMGSNPNLDLSKLGNTQIIHMLQGNEDAIQAKSRAWQDWQKAGNGTDSYPQFQNDFNHHFDPRVFQQQYMGPSEITALRKSLTGPGEARKFQEDVAFARDHKWIQ